MSHLTEQVIWGEIDGREISFPLEIPDLDAASLVFTVPADAASALVPGDAFELVEVDDGKAQFVVALCDYHDNPWGDYLEINLGFLVRPAGAPAEEVGSFVYRMPVDQAFTCEAGNRVMGFPKTVEALSVQREGGRVRFAWELDGQLVVAFSFAEPAQEGAPPVMEMGSYSYLDGVAHETPFAMAMGTGVIDPATVEIELGTATVADELRALGLPTTPDFGSWGTGLSATFGFGRPLR